MDYLADDYEIGRRIGERGRKISCPLYRRDLSASLYAAQFVATNCAGAVPFGTPAAGDISG